MAETLTLAKPRSIRGEMARFAVVGAVGLLVDLAVLRSFLALAGNHPYLGQALAWLIAVTTNWALNRRFTFTGREATPLLRQWAHYLLVNSGGAVLNYATYAALVALLPLCARFPELAAAAGSLAGMVLNFAGSRRLVFKA